MGDMRVAHGGFLRRSVVFSAVIRYGRSDIPQTPDAS